MYIELVSFAPLFMFLFVKLVLTIGLFVFPYSDSPEETIEKNTIPSLETKTPIYDTHERRYRQTVDTNEVSIKDAYITDYLKVKTESIKNYIKSNLFIKWLLS